ncbi:MAG: insulinase family protein [Clostridia bacterium]|nr:insulinase family protein [Clostridia bacterium]
MEKVYSNGLRLVSLPKKDKKVCCVVLYIAGGTQSEKNYQSGISEYLTKILLMGTRKHPTAEGLFNYAKENGIVLTAHNSKESISISALCLNKNVKAAIELLSEIAFETNFSVENGEKARKTQLSQVAMLAENPLFVMDKLLNSTLYYRTGLANPKHGSNISVSRFRTLDAKDFLEKIFTPRNTIISVVGNVDDNLVEETVKVNFFDKMNENEKVYKKLKYVSNVDDFVGSCKGRVKKLNQTRIKIAFPTFSFKDKEKYIIEIIKPIILNHLKQSLSNLDYYFDTKINTKYYSNNGNITFDIMVDYEFAEEHLQNFVNALYYDIKNREIYDDEFKKEKNVFITNFLNKYDDVVENALISAKTFALTKKTFSESSELLKMDHINISAVNNVLKRILNFKKMVIVYLGHDIEIDYDKLVSIEK